MVNVIKYSRLRWAGHIARINENKLRNKILYSINSGGQRGRCVMGKLCPSQTIAMTLQNAVNHSLSDTDSHPRRFESSATLL
jgi:hypothetical protein